MINRKKLEKILKLVEKPARYIGMEKNSIVKDFDKTKVKFAFCFPDNYELAMSYLGLHILYFLINQNEDYLCERAFLPNYDMEKMMREENLELFSLENKEELKNFDAVGFTLQYEMSFANILRMLDLANLELKSIDRKESDPIIVAGGPCAVNPEPIAEIIDVFQIGEGEEMMLRFLELLKIKKEKNQSKDEFLETLAKEDGFYVPKFYKPHYNEDGTIKNYEKLNPNCKDRVKRNYISSVDKMFQIDRMIVPYIDVVHKRAVVEIFRGCTKGCRFCQAGMLYRPIREKSEENIKNIAKTMIDNTGYDDVSLFSLSTCDYTNLREVAGEMKEYFVKNNVSVSLPSLRLDSPSIDVLKDLSDVRKSSLTFAPEAGSQRLRDVINKNVTEENLVDVMTYVFGEGWSKIKLYFMIGLPTETEEDIRGIKELAYLVRDLFFKRDREDIKGDFRLVVSTSCFVPKPFTPFQWFKQDSIDEFYEKIGILRSIIKDKKVEYNYHDPELSYIEAVLARGDRKLSDALIYAYKEEKKAEKVDNELIYENYLNAFKKYNLDPDFYARRERSFDEVLPWDIIDVGVSKEFLKREYEKSIKAETTKDCRISCNACGIKNCEMRGKHENFV